MDVQPVPGDTSPPLLDPAEVRRALEVLASSEQVIEVRVLDARMVNNPRYAYLASGYFNEIEALLTALSRLRSAQGVYITLHPCNPVLLARARNRLRTSNETRNGAATSDQHITRLRWLLIDIDPERPAGISATEEEHEAALLQAGRIKEALHELGWPDPLEADSGNGAHLLYAIDLPVEEGTKETGLLHRVLKGLAARFDKQSAQEEDPAPRVLIDQTVFNPSRICKLYGTRACKGDHTPERPHRMARLLNIPTHRETVPRALLETLATPVPAQTSTHARSASGRGTPFNLARWIEKHQLEVDGPTPWQGGQRWVLRVCPWDAEHTNRSAYIVQHASGAISAGCHHMSCVDKGWKDLRVLYEPEWKPAERTKYTRCPIPLPGAGGDELPEIEIDFVLDCLEREEEGDAQLYAQLFYGRCIYDHTDGVWYEWQGHFWKRDDCKHALLLASGPLAAVYLQVSAALSEARAEIEPQLMDLLKVDEETNRARERYKWLKGTTGKLIERAQHLRTLSRATNVLIYAQALLPITANAWDTDPWLLGTADGVIDLRHGTLRPGKPTDYIRTIIPTRWRGLDAPAPRFEQFLHEIFADRTETARVELIAFLQRALGYGISGMVTEHIFLMLYGEEGRNGKDTLMSLLHSILGAAVGPVSNDVILASGRFANPGSAKPHFCSLQGKRIAWASETDRGARFDIGQVKFLTGGGAIAARQLYGRDYIFEPSHLLVLLTNHKPHADSSDAAFWERLCPIVFNIRFVEKPTQPNERQRDTLLGQTLQAEASGILAWLVRGCLQWQSQRLTIPASILLARSSYRDEEDTLGDFLRTRCVFDEQCSIEAGKLYEHYKNWAMNNSLKYLNGRAFGQEMRKRVTCTHMRAGNVYQGIDILADDTLPAESVKAHSSTGNPHGMASQAAPHYNKPGSCEGSEGTFHKTPYRNHEIGQTESFSKMPSLPSRSLAFEQKETGMNRHQELSQVNSNQTSMRGFDPSPAEFYEEFDL